MHPPPRLPQAGTDQTDELIPDVPLSRCVVSSESVAQRVPAGDFGKALECDERQLGITRTMRQWQGLNEGSACFRWFVLSERKFTSRHAGHRLAAEVAAAGECTADVQVFGRVPRRRLWPGFLQGLESRC